jgi:UDP-N-acetylmuramate--alanine ligase
MSGPTKFWKKFAARCLTYGLAPDADIQARDIRPAPEATVVFGVYRHGQKAGGHPLERFAGRHNVINSLAAVAVGTRTGHPLSPKSPRPWRRLKGWGGGMEWKGERGGVAVMDDYGHHPTEIKATLQALKEKFPHRRSIVLFQPHRFSRTKILAEEFAVSFAGVDVLGLLDIYAASESPLPGVTSDWLAERIRAKEPR